jgi:hypothetical protein
VLERSVGLLDVETVGAVERGADLGPEPGADRGAGTDRHELATAGAELGAGEAPANGTEHGPGGLLRARLEIERRAGGERHHQCHGHGQTLDGHDVLPVALPPSAARLCRG